MLPSPFSNCGLPEFPATTLPFPGNMAYWGGHVQAAPKVYIVYWGWGEPGAFPASQTCALGEHHRGLGRPPRWPATPTAPASTWPTSSSQIGGTQWAGVQTQYYQTVAGAKQYITNPTNQLGGIWVDDTNDASRPGQDLLEQPARRHATPTPTWPPKPRGR